MDIDKLQSQNETLNHNESQRKLDTEKQQAIQCYGNHIILLNRMQYQKVSVISA